MLTRECRPQSFEEMAGQQLNKRILQSIIDNPEKAPKVIIMQGAYGTGKTTSARIFAKALNCESSGKKPCGKCRNCTENLDTSSFYTEYDSAVIGSIDKIRELRDTFFYTMANGYKVIVFDEVHLASKAAQSALLKILEESPERVFYILATTDVDKVLPTIRSRSIELRYESVKEDDVVKNLRGICTKKGIEADDSVLVTIARKSRGHMRNAHMFLDQYVMIGEDDFKQTVKSSRDYFVTYFLGIAQKNKDKVFQAISDILTFPLAESSIDYQEVLTSISKTMVGYQVSEEIKPIVDLMGVDVLKLLKLCISEWVIDSFKSDMTLQTALLCIYQMMAQSAPAQQPQSPNTINRAARR